MVVLPRIGGPRRGRFHFRVLSLTQILALLLVLGFFSGLFSGRARQVLTLSLAMGSLGDRVVVVDPGHGGWDPGVTADGVREKDLTLSVARYLAEHLRSAGARVVMTRDSDRDLSDLARGQGGTRKSRDLRQRVEIINAAGADVLISIHVNGFPSSRWSGAQTFYDPAQHPASEHLARAIQAELKRLTPTDRAANSSINQYILKNSAIPAVTVEIGFISNPRERELLQDPDYQNRVAWAIFLGLANYFQASEAVD